MKIFLFFNSAKCLEFRKQNCMFWGIFFFFGGGGYAIQSSDGL